MSTSSDLFNSLLQESLKEENFKMEEPSYGIIFVNENNLTFHIHDFMNKGKIYEGDENYLGFPNID